MFKAKATQELMAIAKNGQLLSSAVKLSKLFRPGTLLNALRQLTARLFTFILILLFTL